MNCSYLSTVAVASDPIRAASEVDIVPLSGGTDTVFGTERLRTGRLASVHHAANRYCE